MHDDMDGEIRIHSNSLWICNCCYFNMPCRQAHGGQADKDKAIKSLFDNVVTHGFPNEHIWIFDEMVQKVRFYLLRVSIFPFSFPLRIGIFSQAVTTPYKSSWILIYCNFFLVQWTMLLGYKAIQTNSIHSTNNWGNGPSYQNPRNNPRSPAGTAFRSPVTALIS